MRSARLVVYEHDRLVVGQEYASPRGGTERFEAHHFAALAKYHDRTDSQAFALGHESIRLRHHVGYLRVGPISLEVYPKLGRDGPDRDWRGLLLHMLRVVTGVRFAPQEHAPLKPRAGELFDVLLARFLNVTQTLLRDGLARSYREVEENSTAFRGRLLVGPQLRANHVRKERMFVAYEVHDADNLHNRILHRAVDRVLRTTSSPDLLHQAESALTQFPDVSTAPIRDAEWSALRFDRRTERYREAITLARMVLRDERPDLRWGEQEVIALLFDMNALFEAYVEQALRGVSGVRVRAQRPARFWLPSTGPTSWVKPDLLLFEEGIEAPMVLDTKWKIPERGRPADDDLRQVFAYIHTFGGREAALVYPRASAAQRAISGTFVTGEHPGRLVYLDLFAGGTPDLAAFRLALPALLGLRGAECPVPTRGSPGAMERLVERA